jgi:hypothetical protein
VEHMTASERAWLVIRPVNKGQTLRAGPTPKFFWEVRNVGKTPARLIETQAVCRMTDEWNLSSSPIFPAPVVLSERILAPDDSMEFHTGWIDSNGDWVRAIANVSDVMVLLAYGYVRYLTILGEQPCESRFCDDFFAALENSTDIVFRRYLNAPADYTNHT